MLIVICSFILSLLPITLLAQNKRLLLGTNTTGVAFGNSFKTSGIRFNFWDKAIKKSNGISIAVKSQAYSSNGIGVGLLLMFDSLSNGIRIGGIVSASEKSNGVSIGGIAIGGSHVNGIAVGGLVMGAEKINGVGISCVIISDTMNGFFAGVHGLFSRENQGFLKGVSLSAFVCRLQKLNGFSLAALTNIKEQQGVTIGLYNYAKHLQGIQFGLWNVAMNKKRLKKMPFLNFNFKKSQNNQTD